MDRRWTRAEREADRVLQEAKAEFASLDESWQEYQVDVELLASLLFGLGVQRVPDLRAGEREYAAFLEAEQGLIAVEANHHPHRQRFSVAHEVGHYVLHHLPKAGGGLYRCTDADMEQATDPAGGETGGASAEEPGEARAALHGRREWEANLFAAELLMPQQPLLAMYRVVGGSISRLAKHFSVSPQAMAIRLNRFSLPFKPKR